MFSNVKRNREWVIHSSSCAFDFSADGYHCAPISDNCNPDIKEHDINSSVNISRPVPVSSHPTRPTFTQSAAGLHRLYRSVRQFVHSRSSSRLVTPLSGPDNTQLTTPLSWLNSTTFFLPTMKPSSISQGTHSNLTRVLLSDSHASGLPESYDEVIIDHKPIGAQTMHEASEILHYLSISITSLFMFCVILKVLCLGRRFFRDTNEVSICLAQNATIVLFLLICYFHNEIDKHRLKTTNF